MCCSCETQFMALLSRIILWESESKVCKSWKWEQASAQLYSIDRKSVISVKSPTTVCTLLILVWLTMTYVEQFLFNLNLNWLEQYFYHEGYSKQWVRISTVFLFDIKLYWTMYWINSMMTKLFVFHMKCDSFQKLKWREKEM